jgi:hypothetical protein
MSPRLGCLILSLSTLAFAACGGSIGTGHPGDGGTGGDGGHPIRDGGGGGGGDGGQCGNPLNLAGCSCSQPGATRACYTGPAATENKGICHDGMQSCTANGEFFYWGPCMGDVTPMAEVCTDMLDHDCNGLVGCADPSCVGLPGCCMPNMTRPCYTGPLGTEGVGACKGGTQTCDAQGAWMACVGQVLPGVEVGHCSDGIDNDCNGFIDCADVVSCSGDPACMPKICTPGQTMQCYDGPNGTSGIGVCKPGTKTCNMQGQWGTTCSGEVLPGMEAGNCHDGLDNDCNGFIDCADAACANDPGCTPMMCTPFATQQCYDGPNGTSGLGQCKPGLRTCDAQGNWSQNCVGEVLPGNEGANCHDGIDNDCNGLIDCADPACANDPQCMPMACRPFSTRACYDGPNGTANIGQCRPGLQTCSAQGQWDPNCVGEVLPGMEAGNCHDGVDNDCNGFTDCADAACANDPGCATMACTPFSTRACYTGPAGTAGIGQCKPGMESCTAQGNWSGVCGGQVLPGSEAGNCHDNIDNDCNGFTDCQDGACINDPGCQPMACTPFSTRACYTGPVGTENVGQCKPGTEACDAQGNWSGVCSGQVVPGSEAGNCQDNIDNDCNGLTDCADPACFTDPACVCRPNATQPCYDGPLATDGVGACHAGTQTCDANGGAWGPCNGEVLPTPEAGHCADGIDNDCNGQTDCADSACTMDPSCCVPTGTIDTTIYATSATDLYWLDPTNWSSNWIGSYGVTDRMTDIGMASDGTLYTISATSLYTIDVVTGAATYLMAVSGAQNNALTFMPPPDARLLAADASGMLKVIDPALGTVTNIGLYGNGYGSSGDLVAVSNGTMFGVSATDFGGVNVATNNILLIVDTNSGAATPIGPTGFGDVFGMAFWAGRVIAVTTTGAASGQVIEIDAQTGVGTLLSSPANQFFGATTSPLVPINGCP